MVISGQINHPFTIKKTDSIFNQFGFDAITISPYMGSDSITPFIEDKRKGVFVLWKSDGKCILVNQAMEYQYKNFTIIKNNACLNKKIILFNVISVYYIIHIK